MNMLVSLLPGEVQLGGTLTMRQWLREHLAVCEVTRYRQDRRGNVKIETVFRSQALGWPVPETSNPTLFWTVTRQQAKPPL